MITRLEWVLVGAAAVAIALNLYVLATVASQAACHVA